MYNKKLAKIYAGCALSMAFAMAVTPINALAAETTPTEVNTTNPGTTQEEKDTKAAETKTRENLDPTATEDDPATTDVNETYTDTVIDVWGYTEDRTVYSVDVEWGAMTFQYEASKWDPENLTSVAGRGWQVYDNVNDKVLLGTDDATDVQDAINRITVTNHSNAAVYAKLTYTGETGYGTTGTFAATDAGKKTTTNTAEDSNAAFNAEKGVITLQTADNGTDGAAGTATVGNVYFMPNGIENTLITGNNPTGIAQWTKIGKITVALSTTDPTVTPAETPSVP